MIPFVIISQARSGSTMVGSAVSRHPNVVMHGEIFGAHHYPLNFYGVDENLPWPTPLEIALKKIRDHDVVNFLDQFVFADTARARVGFKFKFEEFALWPAVIDYIAERKVPIIYLRRLNLFDRYVSDVKAAHSGVFNTTDKANSGTVGVSDILSLLSVEKISQSIDAGKTYHNTLRDRFYANPILSLTYEGLLDDWAKCFRDICNFLKITELNLLPISERMPPNDHFDSVFDRSAARDALRRWGYEGV